MTTYCIDVESTTPKRTTPQCSFDTGSMEEYFTSRKTLYGTCNFCRTVGWNTLNQKMNMVLVSTYFQKLNFIPILYVQTGLTQYTLYLGTQNKMTILGRTNQMIEQQRNIMTPMFMCTCAHAQDYCFYSREANLGVITPLE